VRRTYDFVAIGGGSAGFNAARVAASLGKRVAVIDGAPHNVYWEAAEQYNAAVSKFLDEVV